MYIEQSNQVQGLSNCYSLNNCGLTTTASGELALTADGISSLLSSINSNDNSMGFSQVISQLVDLVAGLIQRIFGPSETFVSEQNSSLIPNVSSSTCNKSTDSTESGFKFKDLIEIGKDALSIISGRKTITGTFKAIGSAIKKITSWF